MNDTLESECLQDLCETERNIIKYLCERLQLEQLTDPQLKQLNFEYSKKKLVFSLRSLDSDTDLSDYSSSTTGRSCSLKLARSPLILKRLSGSVSEQLQ